MGVPVKCLQAFGQARVVGNPEVLTTSNGDRYAALTVKFDTRELQSGAKFTQRIKFRSFAEADIALIEKGEVPAGTIVFFDGECDAVAEEQNGKWYANPRVTGRLITWRQP